MGSGGGAACTRRDQNGAIRTEPWEGSAPPAMGAGGGAACTRRDKNGAIRTEPWEQVRMGHHGGTWPLSMPIHTSHAGYASLA
jgi:hypothetical protein